MPNKDKEISGQEDRLTYQQVIALCTEHTNKLEKNINLINAAVALLEKSREEMVSAKQKYDSWTNSVRFRMFINILWPIVAICIILSSDEISIKWGDKELKKTDCEKTLENAPSN